MEKVIALLKSPAIGTRVQCLLKDVIDLCLGAPHILRLVVTNIRRSRRMLMRFVVKAAQTITHTDEYVEKLAGCIMCRMRSRLPSLRCFQCSHVEEVKRTCCLIVGNMCKVVENPAAVIPIVSNLDPFVKVACENLSNLDRAKEHGGESFEDFAQIRRGR